LWGRTQLKFCLNEAKMPQRQAEVLFVALRTFPSSNGVPPADLSRPEPVS
jgi:hypothetical protein